MLGRSVLLSSAAALLLGLLLGVSAQAQQLRGVKDEFGAAVDDYYHGSGNAASSSGRGLVVGDDDAWAPVVGEEGRNRV